MSWVSLYLSYSLNGIPPPFPCCLVFLGVVAMFETVFVIKCFLIFVLSLISITSPLLCLAIFVLAVIIFVKSFSILFAPLPPCCLVFQGWSQYQHKSAHLLHTARHSMCFSPFSNISDSICFYNIGICHLILDYISGSI